MTHYSAPRSVVKECLLRCDVVPERERMTKGSRTEQIHQIIGHLLANHCIKI